VVKKRKNRKVKDFDLRKYLAENKLLKEDFESWPIEIQSLKDAGYEVKGRDGADILSVSKDGVIISRLSPPLNRFEDIKIGKVMRYTGFADFIDYFSSVSSNPEDGKEVKGMLRGQELLDFFNFTKYMNVDVKELENEFKDAINSGQFTDSTNVEQDKKDFTYENGDRFLDTNEDKMSEYLGFEIDTSRMIDDYTMGEPMGVEFVNSDKDFEGWMDEVGSFWR
tara:strand:- start:1 stop:669 length:669 start_codon:yes stop_codon:yes gene_type:complete